ncbi:hypothetical protein B0O99DRAFT_640474 [Bisporella sp. PMI_857]|nr:hypothetical protein B0O99DRAFT_640474 [Bisporella sp. PMI_857]
MPTPPAITFLTVANPNFKLSLPVMPQPRWDMPELSIGLPNTSLSRLGRNKCWSLKDKSPAHLVWKKISMDIINLLGDRFEHLDAGGSELIIEMFMIGKKPTSSSPTILFSSESKICRHNAMAAMQKKGLLAKYPGVLMAGCSQLPRLLALEEPSDISSIPPGVYLSGPFRSYGTSVMIYWEHQKRPRKATIGGMVLINNEIFGVTTAHAFSDAVEEETSENEDFEFAFYGSDGPYNSSDDEEQLLDTTSQGGKPPGSITPPSIDNLEFDASSTVGPSSAVASSSGSMASVTEKVVKLTDLHGERTTRRLGTISASAAVGNCLDWALVKIEHLKSSTEETLLLDGNIVWENKTIRPKSIGSTSADTHVLICTGSNGVAVGELLGVASFMKGASARSFQQLLVVRCTVGSFAEGDCGSWVFDFKTGDVYGHVVSGYPGTGIAYVVPCLQMFQDIQQSLGTSVELFITTSQNKAPNIQASTQTVSTTIYHELSKVKHSGGGSGGNQVEWGWIWKCSNCQDEGMTTKINNCPSCDHLRCGDCEVTAIPMSRGLKYNS